MPLGNVISGVTDKQSIFRKIKQISKLYAIEISPFS